MSKITIICPQEFSILDFNPKTNCSGFPSIRECQECKHFTGRVIDLSSLTPTQLNQIVAADIEGNL